MSETGAATVVDRISKIAERVAVSEGLELVEVQLSGGGRRRLLRIYIDKPGGVTLHDCENISQQVGTILDVEDVVPGDSYTLEVSSPGVERKLRKPEDFERFAGEKAKIVVTEPVEGQMFWIGTLRGLADGIVRVEVSEERIVEIPLDRIKKANLKFEW